MDARQAQTLCEKKNYTTSAYIAPPNVQAPSLPPEVRLSYELRPSFGRSVGVRRLEHVVLEHGLLIVLPLPVHLVGGHVHESLDADLKGGQRTTTADEMTTRARYFESQIQSRARLPMCVPCPHSRLFCFCFFSPSSRLPRANRTASSSSNRAKKCKNIKKNEPQGLTQGGVKAANNSVTEQTHATDHTMALTFGRACVDRKQDTNLRPSPPPLGGCHKCPPPPPFPSALPAVNGRCKSRTAHPIVVRNTSPAHTLAFLALSSNTCVP